MTQNHQPPTTQELIAKFDDEASARLALRLPIGDVLANRDADILKEREERDKETPERRAARVPKLGSGATSGLIEQPEQRFSLKPPALHLPN